jgi:hypothetical protein
MPSVLDTAKDATYTAIGLNVLFFEELSELFSTQRDQFNDRFSTQRDQLNDRLSTQRDQLNDRLSTQRDQLNEQLDIARDHAKSARDRMVPVARRSWEAAEPTVTRISGLTPAPFDSYVNDGVAKLRGFVGEEAPGESAAAEATEPVAKKATKKETTSEK